MSEVQLHLGDCLEIMRLMESKSVDAVITDPPYGLGIAANPVRQKHDKQSWDNSPASDQIIAECVRVSKEQVIWGGNYFNLPPHKNFLVWDKMQPQDLTLAMCEMAWSSYNKPAKLFRYSVQREGANIHPTQKPVALMKWCLELLTEQGQTVLDPFMGSGTTGVACVQTGRNFIGCEISKDYYDIAAKRIADAQLQERMPI